MKIRKHKNKTFAILSAIRNSKGSCKVIDTVVVQANDGPSALRAFLFGRDASNIAAHVLPL